MKRVTIRLILLLFFTLSSGAQAFGVLPLQRQHLRQTSFWLFSRLDTTTGETTDEGGGIASDQSRRRTAASFLAMVLATPLSMSSSTSSFVAHAGLLDDYGTDPKSLQQKAPSSTTDSSSPLKPAVAIDPTLRGSYYYPTAKKRYLPRIIKVSSEIKSVPEYIAQNDWVAVTDFAKVAENAILPLQLYQSSLDGQGLSMSNAYAKAMKEDALQYEKAYQRFNKAVRAQNGDSALQAVSDMGVAIADYRQQGRLSDDDGNIPSVDEMRRMAMRRQTGKYDRYE